MEKQIEEMAWELCDIPRHPNIKSCEQCGNKHCHAMYYAERAINAGYRKVVTSDWLTKGISEEQLKREKQEALDEFAERLGYRKQSEGEWIKHTDEYDCEYATCSCCGEDYYDSTEDTIDMFYNFCPNCGSKMRGSK